MTANVTGSIYLDMVVLEGGTPPATALLCVASATVRPALGPQLASVAQTNDPGTWPGPACWPPTGVMVLA